MNSKLLSIFKYVLFGVSVVTLFSLLFLGEDGGTSVMLVWTYVLMGIALAVSILFPLYYLIQNPKGAVRSLVGLGIVVVVLGISYALSSAEPVVNSAGGFFTDPTELRVTDVGLYATYFAMAAAVIAILVGEIRSSIR